MLRSFLDMPVTVIDQIKQQIEHLRLDPADTIVASELVQIRVQLVLFEEIATSHSVIVT